MRGASYFEATLENSNYYLKLFMGGGAGYTEWLYHPILSVNLGEKHQRSFLFRTASSLNSFSRSHVIGIYDATSERPYFRH